MHKVFRHLLPCLFDEQWITRDISFPVRQQAVLQYDYFSSRSAAWSEFIIWSPAKSVQCVGRTWIVASCKLAVPILVYIRWRPPWRHRLVSRHGAFLFLGIIQYWKRFLIITMTKVLGFFAVFGVGKCFLQWISNEKVLKAWAKNRGNKTRFARRRVYTASA